MLGVYHINRDKKRKIKLGCNHFQLKSTKHTLQMYVKIEMKIAFFLFVLVCKLHQEDLNRTGLLVMSLQKHFFINYLFLCQMAKSSYYFIGLNVNQG